MFTLTDSSKLGSHGYGSRLIVISLISEAESRSSGITMSAIRSETPVVPSGRPCPHSEPRPTLMFVIPLSGSVHLGLIDSLKPFDSGPIHAVAESRPRPTPTSATKLVSSSSMAYIFGISHHGTV